MSKDTSEKREVTTFGAFLSDHYQQFAIMGIFATVSAFFSGSLQQNTAPPSGTRAGLIASLLLLAAVTIWVTYQALAELSFIGNMPLTTEFGLATLVLTGGTLLYSVAARVSQFEITLIFANLMLFVGAIIIIVGRFPKETYNNVIENAQITPLAFITSFFYLIFLKYPEYIESTTTSALPEPLNVINIITLSLTFSCISLPLAEAFLGLNISQVTRFRSITERLYRPFLLSESILIASLGIFILSLVASNKAGSIPQGQLEILGYHWKSILFYHWFSLSLIVVYYRFYNTEMRLRDKYLQAQVLCVSIFVVTLVESLLTHLGFMSGLEIAF
ncbi:hypothetical protein [Haloarcula argentinensis]|uniref:hypothetical protein n=1 Tax=Haloarcula argentinensis TaxID=43776 RepID=UPI0012694CAD|nr:hypothetical protein [Haloarcula argentinensis]